MTPIRNPSFSLDAEIPSQGSSSSPRPARKPRTGFFVPLNPETGDIDMARANPEQIAKLQAAIKPKEETKETKARPEINPALIESFYSLLEVGIQRAGKFILKWPPQLANEMYFSPDKKAALIQPTKELAEEFAPAWIVEHQAFVAFGAALGAAVNDMVEKGMERYMTKVLKGEAPPPPGFKFPVPPPRTSPAPLQRTASTTPEIPPNREAPTPVNGSSAERVTVTGATGFIPKVPPGLGVQ